MCHMLVQCITVLTAGVRTNGYCNNDPYVRATTRTHGLVNGQKSVCLAKLQENRNTMVVQIDTTHTNWIGKYPLMNPVENPLCG